jgi:hypothetical protein
LDGDLEPVVGEDLAWPTEKSCILKGGHVRGVGGGEDVCRSALLQLSGERLSAQVVEAGRHPDVLVQLTRDLVECGLQRGSCEYSEDATFRLGGSGLSSAARKHQEHR